MIGRHRTYGTHPLSAHASNRATNQPCAICINSTELTIKSVMRLLISPISTSILWCYWFSFLDNDGRRSRHAPSFSILVLLVCYVQSLCSLVLSAIPDFLMHCIRLTC